MQKADTGDSHHSVTPVCRSYPSLSSLLMDADLFEANAYSVRLVRLSVCVRTTLHLCVTAFAKVAEKTGSLSENTGRLPEPDAASSTQADFKEAL